MMTRSPQGTALITGASSGIGAHYAEQLARRGYDLILVARDRQRLDALAQHLTDATRQSVQVLPADLADPAALAEVERTLREDASLTLLVNNAGMGTHTPLLQSDPAQMLRMIALNVTALTQLTYAAVPAFVARGRGAIINVSSIVSLAPELLNGVYGGSKAYVTAFTQSLQRELAGTGVRAQAVLPGATATDFWARGGLPLAHLDPEIVMSPADLVAAALADFEREVAISIPSLHDLSRWETYEASRLAMADQLSSRQLAPRYHTAH